jgi:DNA-binding transcriptional ArsR family regulator
MEISSVLRALAALAQETRLRVFRLLVEHGLRGLPAGEIGRQLGLPPATLSFHIKELATAGLVSARQQGRSIRYATDFPAMRNLVAYLSENYCVVAPGSDDDQQTASTSDCSSRPAGERPVFTVPKPTVRPKRRAA